MVVMVGSSLSVVEEGVHKSLFLSKDLKLMVVMVGCSLSVLEEGVLKSLFLSKD